MQVHMRSLHRKPSKGAHPKPLTGGTSSEPLPQYEQLHQDFKKSQNYQTGSVMPSKNHGTTTPT
ncbi:hypothetical protein ACS0TY_026210 [Phlomoides rotata]